MNVFIKSVVLVTSLSGLLASCTEEISVTPESAAAQNAKIPAIVSAISTSNADVYVSFSKPMGDSAANVANYVITQENINAEVGTLIIKAASFPVGDTEHTSVILETSPQNEVTYRVQVSAIKDADGNPIIGVVTVPGGTIDTSSVTFAGSAPSQVELAIVDNGVGGIAGWVDGNNNSVIDAGDSLSDTSGNNIILTDFNGDGIIDNWADNDNSGTVTAGDIVSGFQDTDGDGLTDSQELYGENVYVEKANGEVVVFAVTSDPTKADTDGDGLNDLEELNIGTNPRNTDTDGDSISDYTEWNVVYSDTNMQDTDQDGLIDGLEHNFYHTSVLLSDTDGDQLTDSQELLELNRNPRIADIPKLEFSIGDVRLQIDERYSYTDENGEVITSESNTSTSLANSQNHSFTRTDGGFDEISGGFDIRTGFGNGSFYGGDKGVSGGIEFTGHFSRTTSTNWQTDDTSTTESQQAYESSLSKGRELSATHSVSREVVAASIDVDITVANIGNVPFTVNNLEITVLQQVGNRDQFLPVATLVSNSELVTGTPLVINLGGLNNEHGPFLFSSREVFPNLVEQLMRNPAALIFRVANYDVTDELGRNYAYSNQVARDRTGSITLDYGDAAVAQQYLVATNGALENGEYIGGFNASNGRPLGLPLSYMLQSILGIPRHDTTLDRIVVGTNATLDSGGANLKGDDIVQNIDGSDVVAAGPNGWLETQPVGDDFIANPTASNGIVAGLNKTADSLAQGDDIQLVPVGTTGLSIGTIVVDPGGNGVLDTPNLSDDGIDFVRGYETGLTCDATSNKAGDICRIDSNCQCQINDVDARCTDSVVTAGSCSGPQNLVRINSLRNGDYRRGWFVVTSGNLPDAADFDKITIEPGDNITLGFLQDLDKDGLFARNEFLFGSTDSSQDNFINSEFGENFDAIAASGSDGIQDSKDTDHDGLGDYAEAQVGWRVSIDGGVLREVFSSPRFADTDGDGLKDPLEQDLRGYCVPADTRSDALCAFQSESVVLADAIGIIAGHNGIADTAADTNDEQLVPVGDMVAYGTPVVGPGLDGILTTTLTGDDVYESASSIPPATDPTSSDTDLDGITDFNELTGFSAGLAIVDGGNGVAETLKNGDDIQRAFIDNPVFPGGVVILPGQNGFIDSVPNSGVAGDDVIRLATDGVVTDPLRRDTDDDLFADGLELSLGLNPVVKDGDDFVDSDLDGLNDKEESSLGWLVSVDGGAAFTVKSSPSLPDSDFDGLPDFVERDLRTNPNNSDTDGDGISDYDEINDLSKYAAVAALYPNLNIVATTTSGYGTDPTLTDTDGDTLSDRKELIDGVAMTLPGDTIPRLIFTSALNRDTDGDGINDNLEILVYKTDPNNNDTDGDNRSDQLEISVNSDPLVPDIAVKLSFERVNALKVLGDGANGDAEMTWWFTTKGPQDSQPVLLTSPWDMGPSLDGFNYIWAYSSGITWPENQCQHWPMAGGAAYSLSVTSERSRTFILQPGESFSLNGIIAEIDWVTTDCGYPPNYIPTGIDDHQGSGAGCVVYVNKVFNYGEFIGGSSTQLLDVKAEDTTCDFAIQYTITTQ